MTRDPIRAALEGLLSSRRLVCDWCSKPATHGHNEGGQGCYSCCMGGADSESEVYELLWKPEVEAAKRALAAPPPTPAPQWIQVPRMMGHCAGAAPEVLAFDGAEIGGFRFSRYQVSKPKYAVEAWVIVDGAVKWRDFGAYFYEEDVSERDCAMRFARAWAEEMVAEALGARVVRR